MLEESVDYTSKNQRKTESFELVTSGILTHQDLDQLCPKILPSQLFETISREIREHNWSQS